jgi:hypothetical protein
MKEWRYSSTILDFGNRWKGMFNFTQRQLYLGERASRAHILYEGKWTLEPVWKLWNGEKLLAPAGK